MEEVTFFKSIAKFVLISYLKSLEQSRFKVKYLKIQFLEQNQQLSELSVLSLVDRTLSVILHMSSF